MLDRSHPLLGDLALLRSLRALVKRGTKPTTLEVAPLVRAFYAMPGNGAGGSLHVVLDDGNYADAFVDGCIEYATARGDDVGEQLARVLRLMSRTQRSSARMRAATRWP